eukprot:764750-Hanusia_phi.AAC.2
MVVEKDLRIPYSNNQDEIISFQKQIFHPTSKQIIPERIETPVPNSTIHVYSYDDEKLVTEFDPSIVKKRIDEMWKLTVRYQMRGEGERKVRSSQLWRGERPLSSSP